MQPDWIMAGAGAAVLIAALFGVFAYESDQAEVPMQTFPVSWPVDPGPATTHTGELEEDESSNVTVALSASNVTRVEVSLTWTDDVGQPDEFRLTVQPPGGAARQANATNGTILLTFPMRAPPAVDHFNTTTRTQATERASSHASQGGLGDWGITVTLEDAPGQRPVPNAPELEIEPDGSNSFELSFRYEAYRANLGDPDPPQAPA